MSLKDTNNIQINCEVLVLSRKDKFVKYFKKLSINIQKLLIL